MSNTSDKRLEELIRWTGHGDMPDMHALLLDLRRHREAQRPVSDGDLTDEELQRWLQSVPCTRYEPRDMQRMAREIVRHRATVKRLETWQRDLECNPLGSREDRIFAAELRNRVKEPSHG